MKKIKILFYSHTIDFAGTWRSHERILKNLDKNIFDIYVFYNPNKDNNRLDIVKEIVGEDRLIPFLASNNKSNAEEGYRYLETNFEQLCYEINFDIIHFARSGYYEWPFIDRLAPTQIETNIFGYHDNSKFLDCSVAISNTVKNLRGESDFVIYNPIPNRLENNDNLKKELNLSDDELIFGRIGRGDNFNSISLESLVIIKNKGIRFKYIIIGACENTKNHIKEFNLTDECIVLDVTNDDYFIHKFNNTIDIFLHYRSDGETFGTAIAQSMMYGKPVISHYAGFNTQSEIIGDSGYVCNNALEYSEKIIDIYNNKNLYTELSLNAVKRASDFEEKMISLQWEDLYKKLFNGKKHS